MARLSYIVNFESDLAHIIKREFDEHNIFYEENLDIRSLAARYFEMLNRRIARIPRTVRFSAEIHNSLGKLRRQADTERKVALADAWEAVFLIRHLLVEGENVNAFLSKNILYTTNEDMKKDRLRRKKGCKSIDGLLWDFGMHHFHLSKEVEQSGFIKRSAYLLFALVTQEVVYFVDVRRHDDPLAWVRQDLLRIVHSNWPELVEANVLRGVKGTVLTDEEKQELRRKNTNNVAQFGENAFASLGGGMMSDKHQSVRIETS